MNLSHVFAETTNVAENAKNLDLEQNIKFLEQNKNHYSVELPANNDSELERKRLFSQAFDFTLKKNSNNPSMLSFPEIQAAISNPVLYIESFSYVNDKPNEATKKTKLFLRIDFNKNSVSQLLERTSKVSWFKNKPMALMWLVNEEKILNDETDRVRTIKKGVEQHDILLMFPILDIQDLDNIKPKDICDINEETIKKATKRYGTQNIIAGCIKKPDVNGRLTSNWLLVQENKKDTASLTGANVDELILKIINYIDSKLVATTTPIYTQTTRVVLRVSNVNSLDQYEKIVRHLKTFSQMKQIELNNINAATIELSMDVIGGQPALLNFLGGQNKLLPNESVVISPPGINLDYKWCPFAQ